MILKNMSLYLQDIFPLNGNLGLDLSQYNLNQLFNILIMKDSIEIDDALIQSIFPSTFSDILIKNSFKSWISFNTSGIGVVVSPTDQRLVVNDVRIELKDEGSLVWQFSIDIQLLIDIGTHKEDVETANGLVEEHTMFDIYLSLENEYSHCHEMVDNIGMGIIDSTGIVSIIFEEMKMVLDIEPDGPFFSLDISKMGIEIDEVKMLYGDRRCFFDLLIDEGTDFDRLGNCFFSSAATP